MGVPALRYAPPILRPLRKRVPFHDGDVLVRVGHHSGGEKPGDARPEHHSVVTYLPHLALPPPGVVEPSD
jgi:hypothetical protein